MKPADGMSATTKGEVSIVRPPVSRDRSDGPRREKDDGPRINAAIVARQIRVVDADGEMRGLMSVHDALVLAEEAGLDLVEISPNAEPPVCKILDYGKYKYELQKKAAEARKKQKVIEIKEIKLRPMIDDHDFSIKMKNAKSFLGDGDKVKITLRFRGREMAHQDIAQALLARVRTELDPLAKVESEPSFEGRQIVMVLSAKAS
jgi:translation initiation factor IF-3